MGQSADQTVRQIEDTRDRLGTELREFEDRLPEPSTTARRVLLPVGGAVVATGATWLVVRGVRRRAKARAAARTLPARVIRRIVPARVAKSISRTVDDDNQWKLWVTAAGGVWIAIRLAELRQLRRLNRTLVVR